MKLRQLRQQRRKHLGGQVLAEYAIMLAMMTAVALTMMLLLALFSEYGWRVISLIAWEPFS